MAAGLDMLNRPVVSASLRIQLTKEKRGNEGVGWERELRMERQKRRQEMKVNCHQWGEKQAEKVLDISLRGPKPVFVP